MSLHGIFLYSLRAGVFALCVGAVFSLWWLAARRKNTALHSTRRYLLWLVLVCYTAALFQITVIRSWAALPANILSPHTFATVQLVPLHTTLWAWRGGAWRFIYHVVGNIGWFVPMGILLPQAGARFRRLPVLLCTAAGFSLCIEVLQWLLGTGSTDIDDLLLNTLGGVLGWCVWRVAHAVGGKTQTPPPAA